MKNVIKFWSLAVIIALCAGFVSCSKDKKEKEPSIEGRWQLDKDAIPANDLANYKECDFNSSNYREFIKGGEYKEFNVCEDDPIITGTWKQSGKTLTVKVKGVPDYIVTIDLLTEDNLIISATALGTKISKIYKRIK